MEVIGQWMQDFINNNLGTMIVSGIMAGVAWYFTKRHFQKIELKQAKTNVEGSITDNVVKNLDVYQRMFQDLDEQLIKANSKIDELKAELDSAYLIKIELESQLSSIKIAYDALKKKCQ